MANKTFIEVIQQLIKVNDDLLNKKIELDFAKQIAQNTQVIINAAKVQIEFLKISKNKDDAFFKNNLLEPAEDINDTPRVKIKVKTCECGKEFTPSKPFQIYCDDCQKEYDELEKNKVIKKDENVVDKGNKNHEIINNNTEPNDTRKSCDKCINYDKCLIAPKCSIDRYDYFVRKK